MLIELFSPLDFSAGTEAVALLSEQFRRVVFRVFQSAVFEWEANRDEQRRTTSNRGESSTRSSSQKLQDCYPLCSASGLFSGNV